VLIDVLAATALSVFAVRDLPSGLSPGAAAGGAACALAATLSVCWRSRNPVVSVVVAGAAFVGYEYVTRASAAYAQPLVLVLDFYSAGARGASRRQLGQLAVLVLYGIAACALVAAILGSLTASTVAVHALPLVLAPALAGFLVARQRSLVGRLAAATEQLRAGEETRLAVARIRERNRVARELHDVVAHGVSVMVVQAGLARITVHDEPDVARVALAEVIGAGRAALSELGQILGLMDSVAPAPDSPFGAGQFGAGPFGAGPFGAGPPFGVGAIAALVELRRAAGLPVRISVTGSEIALPAPVDAALYRLVQEALTNVVKHAGSAVTDVRVAIQAAEVQVRVRNAAPSPDFAAVADGSGQGLDGMRERVESAEGRLWYGPQPDGGWEVRAQFTLSRRSVPAEDEDAGLAAGRVWLGAGRAASWLRRTGPWIATAAALAALCADACLSGDRRGPLALNIVLTAGMALVLPGWRRFPLPFLVAVNLMALPISNGLASIVNPTVVSTYVFTVPLWAVAYWSAFPAAVAGLALTVAFDVGTGLYWQLGAWSIGPNVLLTIVLWIAGRAVRRQRLMAADLGRTRALLEAEQRAREELALSAERASIVAGLNSLVAAEVSVMIETAESVRDQLGDAVGVGTESIAEVERAGRQGLARLREILGLLRADYDPDQFLPPAVLEDLRDLIPGPAVS
jgi:signal transduction histidine kinase